MRRSLRHSSGEDLGLWGVTVEVSSALPLLLVFPENLLIAVPSTADKATTGRHETVFFRKPSSMDHSQSCLERGRRA